MRTYPWGEQLPDGTQANFADKYLDLAWSEQNVDDGYSFTAPVGSYLLGASPYGALDMAGNVREWVQDWYDEDYYRESPNKNPSGPAHDLLYGDVFRMTRGGSWYSSIDGLSTFDRLANIAGVKDAQFGFRCALSEVYGN